MGNSGATFDRLKKQFTELVLDMHAHKLAIPAGALLVAIVAAIFMMPKSPAPPAPVQAAPHPEKILKTAAVANLTLVGVKPLGNGVPITSPSDPFAGASSSNCRVISSGVPKRLSCRVADVEIVVVCPVNDPVGVCADGGGATGASGSSAPGAGESGGATGETPGSPKTEAPKKPRQKSTYYVVTVKLDGKTYKNLEGGDDVPSGSKVYAIYAGTSSSRKQAVFIAGEGMTVAGVTFDSSLGEFRLAINKTATITDAAGAEHRLTLKSITKVTK